MYSWLYQGSPLVVYPLLALFLFLGVFVAVVVRTFRRGTRAGMDSAARLPLADDERHAGDPDPVDRGASHA